MTDEIWHGPYMTKEEATEAFKQLCSKQMGTNMVYDPMNDDPEWVAVYKVIEHEEDGYYFKVEYE